MNSNGIPKTEVEAAALRAYIPAETLARIHETLREELAEVDTRQKKMGEVYAKISAIKQNMQRERLELKRLESLKQKHHAGRLFGRTDDLRDAAWLVAVEARRVALARGEAARFETSIECGARTLVPVSI